MYIRRSENALDVFWTSYVRSIYVLCSGGSVNYLWREFFSRIGKSCQPLFFPNGPPQMFDDHAFSSEYDNLAYNNLFKVSNKIPGKSLTLLLLQWPGVVRTLHQRQFRCCSGLILITFKKFLPSNNLLA